MVLIYFSGMKKPITWVRLKIKQLYAWTTKWAKTKYAEQALAALSFAESSFFPIPPDPLLIAVVLTNPKKWKRLASITTGFSVLGGIFGFLIGFLLFESIGGWVIESYHLQEAYESLGRGFQDNVVISVFGAALTPLPYKIFTISAGAFHVNFFLLGVPSIIGRGARFFAVAGLTSFLGQKYKDQIEKYIDLISLGVLGLIIVVIVLASWAG